MSGVGWGGEGWGLGAWGGFAGPSALLRVTSVVAVAENVVRVTFDQAVYFSGLRDFFDASQVALYQVAADPTTVGEDGTFARPVSVARVEVAPQDPAGASLDLVLDRSMTPFPSGYLLSIDARVSNAGQTASLGSIDPLPFAGLFRALVPVNLQTAQPANDLAAPSSLAGAIASGVPDPLDPLNLGTIPVDDTGDYASIDGPPALKERIYRRLITMPGGFLHLGPGYGVGAASHVKQLGRPTLVTGISAQAEQQIAQEPEVALCRVTASLTAMGLFRVKVVVQLRSGKAATYDMLLPRAA